MPGLDTLAGGSATSSADSRMYDGSTVNQGAGARIYNLAPSNNSMLYALLVGVVVYYLVRKGRSV
jgi:hypothetical protein